MEIREAILAAADHIERNPQEFDFNNIYIPEGPGCGATGCALGWIGAYAGCSFFIVDSLSSWMDTPVRRMGLGGQIVFYNRMADLFGSSAWKDCAPDCARTLRLYADRWHPAKPIATTRNERKATITRGRLLELLELREGILYRRGQPTFQNPRAGKIAGSEYHVGKKRYWHITVDGLAFRRSHVVYCMTHGHWPAGQVDHIDGNSLNDSPSNLREVTHTQNTWNRRQRTSKKEGLPMGVRRLPSGSFQSRLQVNKTIHHFGPFASVEEAEAAYKQARAKNFGEFSGLPDWNAMAAKQTVPADAVSEDAR